MGVLANPPESPTNQLQMLQQTMINLLILRRLVLLGAPSRLRELGTLGLQPFVCSREHATQASPRQVAGGGKGQGGEGR